MLSLVNPDAPPSITVVIVTYNSAAHLRPTLEALFAQDHPSFEAILLDNASRDDSLAIAREYEPRGLRVIPGATNRGYAGGNNDAVAAGRGRIVVLLNPDAALEAPGALRAIERAFDEQPGLGVLGAKLLAPDGRTILHMGGEIGIPAHCRLFGRGQSDDGRWNQPLDVEFVVGACLAIRRETWERLGGFDEFFNPAYYEDADLCARARRLGLRVVCDPSVRAIHHENVSTDYKSPAFYWMHHKGRLWHEAKNLPLGTLLGVALPREIAWFCSTNAKYRRRMLLGLYAMVLRRWIKRRLLRLAPLHEGAPRLG
jgi:GT2 family glycosyltransferase